jgi:cell division protein FtsW (lipid II flippase)
MAPGPLMVFLLAPRFGKLAERIGQRPILIPGGVIYTTAALLLRSRVGSAVDYFAVWLPFILLSGVGVSMVLPLLTSAAVAGLPAIASRPDRPSTPHCEPSARRSASPSSCASSAW